MKKLFALLFVAGAFTLASCNGEQQRTDQDEQVISRDTVGVEREVEVEETVVEYDTTTQTETYEQERDLDNEGTQQDNEGLGN